MSPSARFLADMYSTTTVSLVVLIALFTPQASAQSQNAEKATSVVAKGEYLAQAGDCVAIS